MKFPLEVIEEVMIYVSIFKVKSPDLKTIEYFKREEHIEFHSENSDFKVGYIPKIPGDTHLSLTYSSIEIEKDIQLLIKNCLHSKVFLNWGLRALFPNLPLRDIILLGSRSQRIHSICNGQFFYKAMIELCVVLTDDPEPESMILYRHGWAFYGAVKLYWIEVADCNGPGGAAGGTDGEYSYGTIVVQVKGKNPQDYIDYARLLCNFASKSFNLHIKICC
jgi:hypothetical protein